MNTTRIVVEAALVLGTAGLLLKLVLHTYSWAIILICIVGLTWRHVRRLRP